MHMPGHKRNLDAFPRLGELGAAFDITEIDGFDNLHSPQGAIADICDRAAEFFGAKRSFLSVNGSTGAILAAIYATTQRGDKVLVARNCHRSVYNAIAAFGLQADFLMPAVDCETGLCGGIRPEDVAKKCASNKYAAVIVTSPTYEGVTSDIRSISRIVRDCGSVLIADEAHGAHFATSPAFPESAAVQGADIVVSGIHKTLPALTQTSLLHLCSDRVPEKNLRRAMSLFVTSSPSYILMSSVDVMLDVLSKDGDKLAENLVASLENFYEKTRGLRHLSVLRDQLSAEGVIYRKDISKIYIDCTKSSLRGFDLKNRLREKHGIVVEYASRDGVLLIASLGDSRGVFDLLAEALAEADKAALSSSRPPLVLPPAGERNVLPQNTEEEVVPYALAEGRIAAENVCVYPPGIPVAVRGETVNAATAEYLAQAAKSGADVLTEYGTPTGYVSVLKMPVSVNP